MSIEIAYIAHAHVCEFLEGKWGDVETPMEWNMHKNLPLQKDINTPSIKNHLNHTWYNVMFHAFSFVFQMSFTNTMIIPIRMFCRYDYAYGPNDHHNDPNRARSIKQGCLATFSIKWLYTWPNVMELCFYHWTRPNKWWASTWQTKSWIINSHVIVCTLNFTIFKRSHIQSSLRHTTKQIYDKHKTIWWEGVNATKAMMKDDFIQQDIVYLDRKHKRTLVQNGHFTTGPCD